MQDNYLLSMQIDVVIPTCNNFSQKSFSLYYTLRSILNQSVQPNKIVVVENFSYAETKIKVAESFGELVMVIDGTRKQQNISYARNLGVGAGHSELIILMDDDVIIGKSDSFERISAKMHNLDFYCGAFRYWTKPDWPRFLTRSYPISHIRQILRHKSYLPKSIERLTGQPNFHEFSFIGHFGAIKRKVFEEINGFDEEFKSWSYQDTDLMLRLCKQEYVYDLMYSDDLFVYHLAHGADKSTFVEVNKVLYNDKQKKLGVTFHLNHFFGIFDDDSYSILS
jgi:GT2 family glycosyltransferase